MRRPLATAVVLALAAVGFPACTDNDRTSDPTSPTLIGPSYDQTAVDMLTQGGQGQGAQFFDNPFVGSINFDPDGSACLVRLSPATDKLNDFLRVNPNGRVFVHLNAQQAEIFVRTPANVIFHGFGTWTANVSLTGGAFMTQASGQVANGSEAKQAKCMYLEDGQGNLQVSTVDLH